MQTEKSRQRFGKAVDAVTLARQYCDDVGFRRKTPSDDWDYLEEISRAVMSREHAR
jgi:hypothetical protein